MDIPQRRTPQEIIDSNPTIAQLVQTPEETEYVQGMETQHFRPEKDPGAKNMGSVIYQESCAGPLEALELINDKLGTPDTADREFLKAKGAPESALLPFANYYAVEGIKGKSRIVSVEDLDDSQIVTLKPSPKGTPSIVISESEAPAQALQDVDYATVIVGPAQGREGETVWTMHAGHPAPMIPIQKEADGKTPTKDAEGRMVVPTETGWNYGQQLTVAEVKAKLGPDTFISIESTPEEPSGDIEAVQDDVKARVEGENSKLDAEFYLDKGGGMLKIDTLRGAPTFEFQGLLFRKKAEIHVSLVPAQMKLPKIVKSARAETDEPLSNKGAKEAVKAALSKAAEGLEFKVTMREEMRKATKGESSTIIQMSDVEGAEEFYDRLEAELELAPGTIERPPLHVTLYTGENGKGIGIATQAQLDELTTDISGDELTELHSKTINYESTYR